MNKYTIITLKKNGQSNRSVAKQLGINRKTVGKIWNEYQEAQHELTHNPELTNEKKHQLTQIIEGKRSYDSTNRPKTKLTPQVIARITEILEGEEEKKETFRRKT